MPRFPSLLAPIVLFLAACADPAPAPVPAPAPDHTTSIPVVSLLGDVLEIPPVSDETAARQESDLNGALADFNADPTSVGALVWVGRRTAYQWRYRDAIAIYTEGLAAFPGEPHLLRHRGHRLITVRDFMAARSDLSAAWSAVEGTPDEIEPDGQPNAAGIPTSTLQTNILYHWGLAAYLLGDFEEAAVLFARCRAIATNDDMRVAAVDWEYMALRRAGRHAEAREAISFVTPDMELLENQVYHKRILMYQGLIPPEALLSSVDGDVALNLATQGYGVGNWYLAEGDTTRALAIFGDVLRGDYWAAFGYIAAEADVARLGGASATR